MRSLRQGWIHQTIVALAIITPFLLPGSLGATGIGQGPLNQEQMQTGVPRQVSLPHLYWHLLMWQNHLDKVASEHEKSGKDGTWLRNHIQKQLGFTDTEFLPVRQSAQHLASAIASLDAQAHSLIKADLALYASGKLTPNDRPPNLDKVKQLTLDREALISSEITRLNTALGANNAAKLKAYVTRDFSKNVVVKVNKNPSNRTRPYGPTRQALGLEAQQ